MVKIATAVNPKSDEVASYLTSSTKDKTVLLDMSSCSFELF